MQLIAFCLKNPVKVAVGVLLTMLFGVLSMFRMPIQLTPEVDRPEIEIQTRWHGASPHEIEREVIQPQEEQLKSVQGILKMSSQSQEGVGIINLEFAVGTNVSETLVKVSNRLQQVKQYPPDCDKPVITAATSSERPIAWIILKPLPGRDDIDITEYGKFAEDYVAAKLKQVPKVAEAEVSGGREPELQVVLNPQQLAARQLTIGELRAALVMHNKDTSGGIFLEGKRQYSVRTRGQFTSPEEVENLIVAYRDGAPVYLRDVAHARMGFKKQLSFVRRVGNQAVSIRVTRETGANVLDVLEGVQKKVDDLNEGFLKQHGLVLSIAYDERAYINSAVGLVRGNAFWGTFITTIILFLFLRAWRSTAVIFLSIPVSIFGTFMLLWMFGRTLNVVSLAGLAFAVGMVVDNAVVVLENIHRRCTLGEPVAEAALKGGQEVWGAVLASTLTTLAVYIPIIFIQQEAGQLFRDIAIANSCAVGLSLIVSVLAIPVASRRFLKYDLTGAENGNGDLAAKPAEWKEGNGDGQANPAHARPRPRGAVREAVVNLFGLVPLAVMFREGVANLVNVLQRSVLARVVVVMLFLGGSAVLTWLMKPPVEYLPEGNRNLVFASLLPPPGYNVDELINIGKQVEEEVRPFWQVEPGSPEERALGGPAVSDMFFIGRDRRIFLGVRTANLLRGRELVPVVRRATSQIPGTIANVSQASLFERISSGGRTVDVEIIGPELEHLIAVGTKVRGQALALLPDSQAIPRPSLDLSSPEVHVLPRWEQAAELGLTATELGYAIDAMTDGAYASDYWSGHDKIDLTIMAEERFVRHTQDLAQLSIATKDGRLLPLESVADVAFSSGPESIHHRERQRAITIQVRPSREQALETAVNEIRDKIVRPIEASGELGTGYQINLSGTTDKLYAAWDAMKWNLIFALLVTYLLMAGLFESWTYPAVIMVSVPPAAVGGLIALKLVNLFTLQALDVLTMLGFVTLIGIVVNNAILIVHQSLNHMREEGMHYRDAIVESVRNRMLPIFMTTVTTLVGLIPLVVAPGAGSELYRGLGAVILGGLAVSTLFTLVLVPIVFSLTLDFQHWLRGDFHRQPAASPAVVALPTVPNAAEVVN